MKDLTGREAIQAIELLTVRVSWEMLTDLLDLDIHEVAKMVNEAAIQNLILTPTEELRSMLAGHDASREQFIEEFDRTE